MTEEQQKKIRTSVIGQATALSRITSATTFEQIKSMYDGLQAELTKLLEEDLFGLSLSRSFAIKELKKYDIVKLNIGPIKHYGVVIAVKGDSFFAIPCSSNTEWIGTDITKSRLLKGKFQFTIVQAKVADGLENFHGVIDNKAEVNRVIRELKAYYKKNLGFLV